MGGNKFPPLPRPPEFTSPSPQTRVKVKGPKHKPFTEAFRLVLPIIFLLIGQLDVYLVPQNLKATGTDHCIHKFLLFSLSFSLICFWPTLGKHRFSRVFLLFTASVGSRKPEPPLVPGVIFNYPYWPPHIDSFRTTPPCFFQSNRCIRTYHAKVKTVELEPIKNWTCRLEILKNRNLYKENPDPTFSKSRQNLANAAKTHVRKRQLGGRNFPTAIHIFHIQIASTKTI